MAKRKKTYQRLPGRGRSSVGLISVSRHSLWLGPDHLLSVRNQGYSEDYKRFYYADIQAIIAHRSAAWVFSLWFVGIVMATAWLLTLAGWLLDWEPVGVIVMGGAGAVLTIAWLGNFLLGPLCITHIQTAVQSERLFALNRMRTVQKALRRLRPYVDAAQQPIDPDEQQARYAAAEARAAEDTSPASMPVPAAAHPRRIHGATPLRRYAGHAHDLLFAVLLADVIHSCARFFAGGIPLMVAGLAVGIALIATLIIALIRQHGTDLSAPLKTITWTTLGYVAVCYVFGMIHSTIYGFSNPEAAGNALEYSLAMANQPVQESMIQLGMLIFSIVGSGCLAVAGFLSLARYRAQRREPPSLNRTEPAPSP